MPEGVDQVRDGGATLVKRFYQAIQPVTIEFVPLRWNRCGNSPDLIDINCFSAGERGFEAISSSGVRINAVLGIDSSQRRIRKVPIPGVEAVTLIDEGR